MINENVKFRQVSREEFKVDEYELASRLGVCSSCLGDRLFENIPYLSEIVSPKYSAVKLPVEYLSEASLKIGDIEIKSKNLIQNLGGAEEAYLLAVTLGVEVDRYLLRLGMMSGAERFVVDGYASALVEALADFAEAEIFGDAPHCKRFSPGYGDVPIDIQGDILTALSAENLLGITLTDKKMMVPTKSITAVIGCK